MPELKAVNLKNGIEPVETVAPLPGMPLKAILSRAAVLILLSACLIAVPQIASDTFSPAFAESDDDDGDDDDSDDGGGNDGDGGSGQGGGGSDDSGGDSGGDDRSDRGGDRGDRGDRDRGDRDAGKRGGGDGRDGRPGTRGNGNSSAQNQRTEQQGNGFLARCEKFLPAQGTAMARSPADPMQSVSAATRLRKGRPLSRGEEREAIQRGWQ